MLLDLDTPGSLNRAWGEANCCRKMGKGQDMEEGDRGIQSVSCMGSSHYRCMQSKCWVNRNSSWEMARPETSIGKLIRWN